MHCHCGTNNRAPRWTSTDPCKPEVRPGSREESASPAWLATPAWMPATQQRVYIWRLDTGCGQTLYRKSHSHNTPGKRHNNTWVKPLAGNCTTVQNLLYTGSHGVVIIRHNFVCSHKWCRFLVFRNFAWGKINALKKNLSEKQFFKQIFEDLKMKGNDINSGVIIPLFLYVVTMPLSISSRTTSEYSAYNYMYSHFAGIYYQRIHINKFVNNMTHRDQWPTTIHLS